MKKKVIGIISLVLAGTMMTISLTGCGTQVKATDAALEDGDTIVVKEGEEEAVSEEAAIETGDESTDTEAVGGKEETVSDFAGAENDNIVLYAEIAEYGEYGPQKDKTFEPVSNTFTAYDDLPVFNGDGIEVGYIKNGSTVTFTGYASNAWARFENPIAGTDYDYLYAFKEYAEKSNYIETRLSAEEMRQLIIDDLNKRDENELPAILDAPDSDMEVYECRISRENDSILLDYRLREALHMDASYVSNYMTYYVECEEDEDYINCKIYYKDSYEEWAGQNN